MAPRLLLVLQIGTLLILVVCASVYFTIEVSLFIKRHRFMKELTAKGAFFFNFNIPEDRFNKELLLPNAVNFEQMSVSPEMTALLLNLNSIQVVNFDDCELEAGALSSIGQSECPVNWIAFRGNHLTKGDLASLPSLPALTTLIIRDAGFSDDCLNLIADRCPNLTSLRIYEAGLTEEAEKSICRLKKLKLLKVHCRDLEGVFFLKILESQPIERLSLPTSLITSDFMREIEENPRVRKVSIIYDSFTLGSFKVIEERMPTVELEIEYTNP